MQPIAGRGWSGLPDISKTMYKNTYFLKSEDYDSWVIRVTSAYANNSDHQKRLSTYLKNYWWHPATPISSNAGTDRGLPISCFVREIEDSKKGIFYGYDEAFWLGSRGTGIGTTWDPVREVGAEVSDIGKSSGIIPFISISDRATLAISQGGLRRASEAVYISVSHPEITEFIDMRKSDRDNNRYNPNIDHGVLVTDAFMDAVKKRQPWDLISRKNGKVVETVDAFNLWTSILDVRSRIKGEPYIIFIDTMNNNAPEEYKILDKNIKVSNLCTEIALNTEEDKSNVCVLSSLNLEYWDEYKDEIDQVVADLTDFLDNVVQDFIDRTEGLPGFERARKGAIEERPLGLGVMGWHSYLQKNSIPIESALATGRNNDMFRRTREASDLHQAKVGLTNPCPMAIEAGTAKRNVVTLAVAPTMSISNLANLTSSGIEPWLSNAFTKKLKQGSFPIRNKHLEKVIVKHAYSTLENSNDIDEFIEDQWKSIKENDGSVQHLTWMDDWNKMVFKTAFEIDQTILVLHAGARQKYIDQAQSLNLFFPAGSHVKSIYDSHMLAWEQGVKSLYYFRSTAETRASTAVNSRKKINIDDNSSASDLAGEDASCVACT